MSQEKSGMTPAELVENWKKCRDGLQRLLDNEPGPLSHRIFVQGSIEGITTAIEGFELEIKRSNYVSGKEVTGSELKLLISDVLGFYRVQNDILVKELLSKYRIIEK